MAVSSGATAKITLASVLSFLSVLAHLKLFAIVLVGALLTMAWEMVTCWWSQPPSARASHKWGVAIGKKLIILSLIVPAMVLDWIVSYATNVFWDEGTMVTEFLPVTVGTLVFTIVAQSLQGIANVQKAEGEENIPRVLVWALRQIRQRDEQRFPYDGVPRRRWWDDLTEDQIAEIIALRREPGEDDKDPMPTGKP